MRIWEICIRRPVFTLMLVSAPPFMATFTSPQLDSLAYLFLRLHGEGAVRAA